MTDENSAPAPTPVMKSIEPKELLLEGVRRLKESNPIREGRAVVIIDSLPVY